MDYSNLKEKLKSFKEDDYWEKVDLHIHSVNSDGKLAPEDIAAIAKEKGYQLISITDHNNLNSYLKTNILKHDFVVPGIEFDCFHKGVWLHILGYGIDIQNKELQKLCPKLKICHKKGLWRIFTYYQSAKNVIKAIKSAGGIAILAHPACYWAISLDKLFQDLVEFGLDGVECYYLYDGMREILKFHHRKTVIELTEKYNLIKTGGTDNHGATFDFGLYKNTIKNKKS